MVIRKGILHRYLIYWLNACINLTIFNNINLFYRRFFDSKNGFCQFIYFLISAVNLTFAKSSSSTNTHTHTHTHTKTQSHIHTYTHTHTHTHTHCRRFGNITKILLVMKMCDCYLLYKYIDLEKLLNWRLLKWQKVRCRVISYISRRWVW